MLTLLLLDRNLNLEIYTPKALFSATRRKSTKGSNCLLSGFITLFFMISPLCTPCLQKHHTPFYHTLAFSILRFHTLLLLAHLLSAFQIWLTYFFCSYLFPFLRVVVSLYLFDWFYCCFSGILRAGLNTCIHLKIRSGLKYV